MKAYMRMMAGYNQWANARLMEDCGRLDEGLYHKDLGAYYNSIHGTLDHVLLVDMIWLVRLHGEGETYDTFDMQLTESFEDYARERRTVDERLLAFVEQATEADLMRTILYRTIRNPVVMEQPVGSALVHVFNHQTHHRGQIHAFLTMHGLAPQPLDLLYFQRESGQGMAA